MNEKTDATQLQELDKDFLIALCLIPQFGGYLVHDANASYFVFDHCEHGLCNAHILRELTFLFEEQDQTWAGEFKNLLMRLKRAVADAQAQHQLEPEQIRAFTQNYKQLLALRQRANPPPEKPVLPKRGRLKQSPTRNLLLRLEKHQDAVLAFIHDVRVPFDNNIAERDLRMMKVKPKISGAFHTLTGAETFAQLRSYISTVRKQSGNVLDALISVFPGQPFMPSPLKGPELLRINLNTLSRQSFKLNYPGTHSDSSRGSLTRSVLGAAHVDTLERPLHES
jgi:transposase